MSVVRAVEWALAAAQVAVSVNSALPKPALAKDKRCLEDAAAEQCRANNKCYNGPVMPLDPVDAAIRRIWVDCALHTAPLDAILAKIASKNIAHKAQAPPTTTSPHPAAILSTPPHPMTYVGVILSTMGGSS